MMNKEIFDQLSPKEKSVAEKLNSTAQNMKVPQDFQWNLESQLMDAYKNRSQPNKGWFARLIVPVAWAFAAVLGFFLLNWTIRSLVLPEQVEVAASNTEIPFETQVRQGTICEGPLALAHGFEVSLTNEDKTAFLPVDKENTIDEERSFAWSADGGRLAVLGNNMGSGAIYIMDSTGRETGQFLSAAKAGYLRDADWSSDGRQMVLWSTQNISRLYLLNTLGHGLIEKKLDVMIIATPKFEPNGRHILFYGADASSTGLFLLAQEDFQPVLMPFAQGSNIFAFSPDGSLLAYMEYDREVGEARLSTQNLAKGEYRLLGTLPIPKGSGSSVPETANLNWSQDGTKLVFEFGRYAQDRAIYIANADGSGMIKVIDAAHAPSISADGNCVAYISNKQVFVLDLNKISLGSNFATPFMLADLPAGRGIADFRLDKLQWRP